jgi:hypothetical protein
VVSVGRKVRLAEPGEESSHLAVKAVKSSTRRSGSSAFLSSPLSRVLVSYVAASFNKFLQEHHSKCLLHQIIAPNPKAITMTIIMTTRQLLPCRVIQQKKSTNTTCTGLGLVATAEMVA